MKSLDDMTEPELRELTRRLCDAVQDRLPPGTSFCLLFTPFGARGVAQYGSNTVRGDMIKMLRETADRLERREDIPRQGV